MEKECYIFGAGERGLPPVLPPRDTIFLIAADGGYTAACAAFGSPDLAVGDFDSLGYVPRNVETVVYPREKDETDLAIAVKEARKRGYRRLSLCGVTGGRLDHTLATLQLMAGLAGEGVVATAYTAGGEALTFLRGGSCATFPAAPTGTLSLFAFGGACEGVTLEGVRYLLKEARLSPTTPLGVSNEFCACPATVLLREGLLLMVYPANLGTSSPIINGV